MESIGVKSPFMTGFTDPIPTGSVDQLAIDGKDVSPSRSAILSVRHGYPYMSDILHVGLYTTVIKQTIRWFLAEIHRYYRLDDVVPLVDNADYLRLVLAGDGYLF